MGWCTKDILRFIHILRTKLKSAFDVGQLPRHFAIPYLEQVHTSNVA
jgi:hypothetical protein